MTIRRNDSVQVIGCFSSRSVLSVEVLKEVYMRIHFSK